MLGVTYIFYSFRLVLEGKTGKEIRLIKIRAFRKVFNNFALSDAEHIWAAEQRWYSRFIFVANTCNSPKSQKPSFWEVIDSFCFISICKFSSLKKPFATTTNLSKFTLDLEDLFCWYKQKKQLLWQQHKHLKTMEINEAWPDTYDEGNIHQFQPESTHKINCVMQSFLCAIF